jgi:hypothetical protein
MLTIEMGNLEALFVQLLAVMLSVPEGVAATILLTPKSTRARTEIIGNLAEMLFPDEISKVVDGFIKRANRILDKRNGIVHEFWGVSKDKKQVCRIPPPYGDPVPIELTELTNDVQTLRKLSDEVMFFAVKLAREMTFRPHYRINFAHQISPKTPG